MGSLQKLKISRVDCRNLKCVKNYENNSGNFTGIKSNFQNSGAFPLNNNKLPEKKKTLSHVQNHEK